MSMGIFILHYKNIEKTTRCLGKTLGALEGISRWHITVIDNGSPEAFSVDLPGVEVIRLNQNLPLIDAFNHAMFSQEHQIYVCMANDTQPEPGMFAALALALEDKTVGIVAPATNDRGVGMMTLDAPDPRLASLQMNHVDNTCWAFRRDLVEQIGWPDADGHQHRACWASNQDFCYRARMAGYKVLCVRSAYIWHDHNGGQDYDAWRAGREWLIKKYGPKAANVWA